MNQRGGDIGSILAEIERGNSFRETDECGGTGAYELTEEEEVEKADKEAKKAAQRAEKAEKKKVKKFRVKTGMAPVDFAEAQKRSQWRVGCLRSLSENGYYTINSRDELDNLILGTIVRIPLAFLVPLKKQTRIFFDKKEISELAKSIRLNGDVDSPIKIVIQRESDGMPYGLIFGGERRLLAAKEAGISHVSCLIRKIGDDKQIFLRCVTDNANKVALTPIEEALAIMRMEEEFEQSDEEIAVTMGKPVASIQRIRRYLDLLPSYIKMLAERKLTKGEALVLVDYKKENQAEVYEIIQNLKKERKKDFIHPNALNLLVRLQAEKKGLVKERRSKKSKGKKLESATDLVMKSIMRGIEVFNDTLDLAEGLKEADVLNAKIPLHELRSSFEDTKNRLDKIFGTINDWD
jgi:ParB/RepB/Spo0J family partition protein